MKKKTLWGGLIGMVVLILTSCVRSDLSVDRLTATATPMITEATPSAIPHRTATPVSVTTLVIPTWTPQPAQTPEQEYVPLPTVDWQATWVTYTNPVLKFSIQHPPGANLIERQDAVYIGIGPHSYFDGSMVVGIRVQSNPNNLSVEKIYERDWIEEDRHQEIPPILQSVVERFDRPQQGTARGFFIGSEGGNDVFWILVSHESKIYNVFLRFGSYTDMYEPEYQSLFVRMMDTFRFMDN